MENNSKCFTMCSRSHRILLFVLLLVSKILWCPKQCQLLWNWEFLSLFILGLDIKLGKMSKCQSSIKLGQNCLTFSIIIIYFYIPEMEQNFCSLKRVIVLVLMLFHGSPLLLQPLCWTAGFLYYTTWKKHILRDTLHCSYSSSPCPKKVEDEIKK